MRRRACGSYRIVGLAVTIFACTSICAMAENSGATTAPQSVRAAAETEPSLCESVPQLTRLVVRRTDAFPGNHIAFSFPAVVSVNDAASVRQAANALCALPRMPIVAMHCPADLGITYHLTFSAERRTFPPISIDATGCQTVRGLSEVRWVARTPGFWKVLGEAMGLTNSGRETFAGSGPNG